ncbi:MAG: GNAT family N-acetyltransferase [Thermoguttaceae bacterium]
MFIQEVKTSHDLKRFMSFPWQIYRNDQFWVPPLLIDVKETLDPHKHPFYKHGEAAKFIVTSDNEVLGRILVADDPRYNAENNSEVGTFGFFESINDKSVAKLLFDAACEWSGKRGRKKLMGPIDYSTNYGCGLLIDGFDSPPRMMMNHNPRYYLDLMNENGFVKNKDLFAWWFQDPYDIVEKWTPLVDRIGGRHNILIRPFKRSNFQEDVKKCLKVYDEARKDWWWSCVSLTSAEVDFFAKRLSMIGDENLVYIAEAEGEPIGFSITMPDYNEAIKPLNGRLTWFGLPIGLWNLWRNTKKIKTARMMVLCVLPKYQKKGVGERLILQTLSYGKYNVKYTGAELSWTDESNDKVNKIIERIGAQKYKTYRVLEKEIF